MIAWLDCSVGCAGDMLLGALVDAGADPDAVRAGLAGLDLPESVELRFDEVHRGAFRALHADVLVQGSEADPGAGPPDAHHHAHHHHHHDHHDHLHRPWKEIRTLLQAARLPERVRERALATFERLAEAEAHLHGMPVEEVVLHEVGAVDAIVDIVGVCLALEDLGIDELVATPLPMGSGHVHGAHGRIPLPAPATLALVTGWPVVPAGRPGEWVTPTGAALITTLARPGGPPAMVPVRTGHGAGRRDPPEVANLVRALVGRRLDEATADAPPREVVELVCNLDDMTGELAAPLLASLLEEGALDAWSAPIVMKKGRPAFALHVLCAPAQADAFAERLLRESSTLGVRRTCWHRDVLDRWSVPVSTPWGEVRVKVAGRGGEAWHAAPELEDVLAVARAARVPAQQVHLAALSAWSQEA